MVFRVSTQSLHNTISQTVLQSQQIVLNLQRGLADGKAIRRPSDDPVGTHIAMRHREWLRAGEQYEKNIEGAISHLNSTDSTIFMVQDLVTEARVLQNRGADDSQGEQARVSLAQQVDQVLSSLVDLGNERFGGVFIFGGTNSLTPPYQKVMNEDGFVEDVVMNPDGIEKPVVRQVGRDLSLSIRVPGTDVFGGEGELFETLIDLRKGLLEENRDAVVAARDRLEQAQNQVVSSHSFVGSLVGRADALRTRLQADQVVNEAGRSKIEDLDVAEAMLEFTQNQVALEAALKAGSRILTASLLDHV